MVRLPNLKLMKAHEELVERKCGSTCTPERLVEIYGLWKDNLRKNEEVKEAINKMKEIVKNLRERARELSSPERLYVLRLARGLEKNLNLVTYLAGQGSSGSRVVEKLILHWSSKGVIGLPGARLAGFIDELVRSGVSVAVVTTSIMSSSIPGYNGIILHPSLERIEYRVFKLKRVYGFNAVRSLVMMRSIGLTKILDIPLLSLMLGYLLKRKGSDVVVVSKTVLLKLLKVLPRERIRVYGDVSRGVIDWVEVVKDNGVDKVYLVYPHGRIAMGVEPPVTSVRSINFVYGVRRPATDYVILRRIPGRTILDIVRHVKKFKQSLESIPGPYVVIEAVNNSIKLMLYTKWDYRYDIHCAAQILGRWFMLDVEIVNIREDYLAGLIRAPFFYFEAGPVREKIYRRLDTGEEVEVQSPIEVLGWASDDPYIDFERYWRNNSAKLDTLLKRLKREGTRGE